MDLPDRKYGFPDNVALPQHPADADLHEIIDVQMSSYTDTQARDGMGTPDLDDDGVLSADVMEESLLGDEACRTDGELRMKELLRNKTESLR